MDNERSELCSEVSVPEQSIQVIDPVVVSKLPEGLKVIHISPHGASFWTRTARLHAELHGRPTSYFLKTTFRELGRNLVAGEYKSMSTIYEAMPNLVPRAIAWGSYSSVPNVHFLLCEFRNMTDGLPDIEVLPARMAELHRLCSSPNGMFGFDVTTYHGNTPIKHGWSKTWEEYFTRTTRELFDLEQKSQGPNDEIIQMLPAYFEKVVPRLLRPLETVGRSIKPSLIHGDLWHGNAAMDKDLQIPLIFDAASFYAHNEYELAVWRQDWNNINKPYRLKYHEHMPPSQPIEDCEWRNVLYASRVNLLDSVLYKNDPGYRESLIKGMKQLIEQFPAGYDGWLDDQESPVSEV